MRGTVKRAVRSAAALVVVMVVVGAGAAVAQPVRGSQTVGSQAEAASAYITFENYKTRQCMGTVNGSVAVGAKVVQRSCASLDPDQVWLVTTYLENTWTTIRNSKNTNMCLAVPGSSTTRGTQLGVYQCSGNLDQQWRLDTSSPYLLQNRNSGMFAAVAGGSTAEGAPIIQWVSDQGINPDQLWLLWKH